MEQSLTLAAGTKKLWKTSNKKHVIQSLLWFQAINCSQIHNLLTALIFGAFSDSAFSLSNVCYKVLTYKVLQGVNIRDHNFKIIEAVSKYILESNRFT